MIKISKKAIFFLSFAMFGIALIEKPLHAITQLPENLNNSEKLNKNQPLLQTSKPEGQDFEKLDLFSERVRQVFKQLPSIDASKPISTPNNQTPGAISLRSALELQSLSKTALKEIPSFANFEYQQVLLDYSKSCFNDSTVILPLRVTCLKITMDLSAAMQKPSSFSVPEELKPLSAKIGLTLSQPSNNTQPIP